MPRVIREGKPRYRVSVNPSDAFGPWVGPDSGEFHHTIAKARKARTEIAIGVDLPTHAIWIWDRLTGDIIT